MAPSSAAAIVLACGVLWLGWWHLWFLTDDAYIFFRYVSNSVDGLGYVWNPTPFVPVEGYTSFLWTVVLDASWRLTGLPPPAFANTLSLLCGFGTVFVVGALGLRQLRDSSASARVSLLALVLLGVVTNRTFITWTASGLETGLFVLLLTAWLAIATSERLSLGGFVWWMAVVGSLAALCRPDGLAFWASGVALVALRFSSERERRFRVLGWALPFLVVPAHLLWRLVTYGEWLPNTYQAKTAGPWPEAGIRYLWSFVLEYGLLVWFVLGVAAFWRWFARREHAIGSSHASSVALVRAALCAGPFVVQLVFYTFVTGGDHFEYRVYAQFIGPLFLFGLWAARTVSARAWGRVCCLVALVVVQQPLPWALHAASQKHVTRAQTRHLAEPIADDLPALLGPWARAFDETQLWLIARSICVRHREHERFWQIQLETYPSTRGPGRPVWDRDRPVYSAESVGVAGWRLQHIAILDVHGLNDRVVARGPIHKIDGLRQMAHEHWPPPGYLECFRPNVRVTQATGASGESVSQLKIRTRNRPLTDEEVRACESRFFAAVMGADER